MRMIWELMSNEWLIVIDVTSTARRWNEKGGQQGRRDKRRK